MPNLICKKLRRDKRIEFCNSDNNNNRGGKTLFNKCQAPGKGQVKSRQLGFYKLCFVQVGTNATPPASKDGVFNCYEQLQLTVELRAGVWGVPLFTVSWSCKEQLKIGLCRPVVWRLTSSGVRRMITCRHLNILCRVYTKGRDKYNGE